MVTIDSMNKPNIIAVKILESLSLFTVAPLTTKSMKAKVPTAYHVLNSAQLIAINQFAISDKPNILYTLLYFLTIYTGIFSLSSKAVIAPM